jgi:hypothetical protein
MTDKISQTKRELFYKQIKEAGFIKDELVGKEIGKPVYGVNITCGWPLPVEIKPAYEILYRKLNELDGVYIYPYSQTHITILTIINFKSRLDQPRRILENETLELITTRIQQTLKHRPIKLLVDAPVLVRNAAFLPFYNPGGEIWKIRKQTAEILSNIKKGYDLDIPQAIHSTILRFKDIPKDPVDFISKFKKISNEFSCGEGLIKEIYFTEELKPYMGEGRILQKIELS